MKASREASRIFVGLVVIFVSLLGFGGSTQAAGLLTPKDGALPALDIKEHDVKVVIEDGYAVPTVEQVFLNPHGQD